MKKTVSKRHIVSSYKNIKEINNNKNIHSKRHQRNNTQNNLRELNTENKSCSTTRNYFKQSHVLGVNEGVIKLPEIKPCLSKWKKLSPEELEIRHKEKMAQMVKLQLSNNRLDTNVIGTEEEEEQDNEYLIMKTAENEIKKLNRWDVINTEKKIPLMRNTSTNISKFAENYDSPSLKWFMEIKNNPKEIALLNRNQNLKDFFEKINEEQKAIFNQSLNINNKKFNFEVFTKGINIDFPDQDSMTANNNRGTTVEFYREVMKEKLKVEEYFKSDLAKVAQGLHFLKQNKKSIMLSMIDLINSLNLIDDKRKQVLVESKKGPKQSIKENTSFREPYQKKAEKEIKIYKQQRRAEHSNDISRKIKKIHSEKDDIERKLELKHKELKDIDIKIRHLKLKLNNKINDHQKYYFEELKKGIDVRRDGISWILIRLIELKAYFEYSKFPKFLSTDQIEYLLQIAYKTYEVSELIKLFQILKKNQKEMKENHLNERLMTASNAKVKRKKSELEKVIQGKQKTNNNNDTFFTSEYTNHLNAIYAKYEHVINICLNEESEDKYIQAIARDLHNRIIKANSLDDNSELNMLYFLPGSLSEVFNQNNKFRQYFDDIVYLNLKIVKKETELKYLKTHQMQKFRQESENRVVKNTVENEMIFAALFGNGINI